MKVTGSTIEQLEKDKPKGKCRKWRLWVTTECGRKSRRITGTWTQAQEALGAFVDELSALVPNERTFGAYARSWLAFRASNGEVRPGTAHSYATAVNHICASPLGSMRMDELTPEACRAALSWMRSHPLSGVGELSGTTMRVRYAVLKMVCAQAVDDGGIASDPMRSIARPRLDTEERTALSEAELHELIAKAEALPMDGRSMAVLLMAYLGLRRGEACAIASDAVSDGYAVVNSTVVDATGEFGPTKNGEPRVLPVPPQLQERVDKWLEFRDALGFGDAPTLCCNTRGGVLHPKNLQKWWDGVRVKLGVPDMVLHQLRHSNLTLMARHMSPFDLQRYAGWKSLAMAMRYVHDDLDSVTGAVNSYWCGLDAPFLHHPGVCEDALAV